MKKMLWVTVTAVALATFVLAEETPPPVPSPIKLSFEAAQVAAKGVPVPVTLVVESNREGWPAKLRGEGCRLELLLRLPAGVRLESDGWEQVELPPDEQEESSGPWSLFERKQDLSLPDGVPPQVLRKETILLAVVEEGTNWIITARARLALAEAPPRASAQRLAQGTEAWQSFAVLFATLQEGRVLFHARPFTPLNPPSSKPEEERRAATDGPS